MKESMIQKTRISLVFVYVFTLVRAGQTDISREFYVTNKFHPCYRHVVQIRLTFSINILVLDTSHGITTKCYWKAPTAQQTSSHSPYACCEAKMVIVKDGECTKRTLRWHFNTSAMCYINATMPSPSTSRLLIANFLLSSSAFTFSDSL